MSRQSRKVRKLVATLASICDQAIQVDSYGVEGSDFCFCTVCGASDAPGLYHKPDWHKDTCTVVQAERAHQSDLNRYWRTRA